MRDYHALIVKEMKRRYFYHANTRATCQDLTEIARGIADLGKYNGGAIARATVEAWYRWQQPTNLDADYITYACICVEATELCNK